MQSDDVNLDFERENRTGLAEAVFCQGKSHAQLHTICERVQRDAHPMLFTRLSGSQREVLAASFPGMLDYDEVSRTAFGLRP